MSKVHSGAGLRIAAALCLLLFPFYAVFSQQDVGRLLDAVVSIKATSNIANATGPVVGTGFVISATGPDILILTARHVLFSKDGDPVFDPKGLFVTFRADRYNPRHAEFLVNGPPNLLFSVLKVSRKDAGNLPPFPAFQLRSRPIDFEDVRVMTREWTAPKLSVSSPVLNTRLDQFSYNGSGIAGGDSGGPVIDLNGQLVGIHQGDVAGTRDGWAQRMQEVAATLSGPTMGLRIDLGGGGADPGSGATTQQQPAAAGPPPAPVTGTVGDGKDGLKYVWIGPGKFTMGCSAGDSECDDDEKPANSVTIPKGFWMGQTPVTVAAWKRYAAANRVETPAKDDFGNTNLNRDDNAPVVAVKWEEARAYCGWAGNLRLPTEAEWEYAGRAGTAGARYADLEKIAMKGSLGQVPSKEPNSWQLFNMLGSVWQWTSDWYDAKYYTPAAVTNPSNAKPGDVRTLRGGSWILNARNVRASGRNRYLPAYRYNFIGFRCVGE